MGRSATETQNAGLREFLNSPQGRAILAFLAVAMIGVATYFIWGMIGPSEAEAIARDRMFIDAKTMKPFSHELKFGEFIPVDAPSGEKTGYPAELCFWTKDGKAKPDPTPVLLGQTIGKSGPTFCPDCGRLVVGHNPQPGPDVKVPPTEAEYKASGGGSRSQGRQ